MYILQSFISCYILFITIWDLNVVNPLHGLADAKQVINPKKKLKFNKNIGYKAQVHQESETVKISDSPFVVFIEAWGKEK